jgi:mannose-1-phosphate guanylyltransferase/mannose-6-phosphate isomerase
MLNFKNSKNVHVHSTNKPIFTLGLVDTIIVDTPDALLVLNNNCSQTIGEIIDEIPANLKYLKSNHQKEFRPWGNYQVIYKSDRYLVKHIFVKPNGILSLQMHYHRVEHWIIVKGTAEVQRGDEKFFLTENQSTYINMTQIHRLKNAGLTDLEMIEVQSGSLLDENDIVRIEDHYGRA